MFHHNAIFSIKENASAHSLGWKYFAHSFYSSELKKLAENIIEIIMTIQLREFNSLRSYDHDHTQANTRASNLLNMSE